MQEKIMGLSLAEKLVAGGGILMLIASIFDWFSYSELGFSFGSDGWSAPGSMWSTLAILISIIMAGVVIATRLGNVQMPALPQNLTWGQVCGGGAGLVVVLMLLKLWRIMAVEVGGPGLGFFLGVIAAAAIAYGGYLLYSEEKKSVTNA
jgi:hypothetical protein